MSRLLPRLAMLTVILGLAGSLSSFADDTPGLPDVVRLRVPSGKVTSFFPPNSPLRVMPRDEFETLVANARRNTLRRQQQTAPRLVRAHHEARWEDGHLIGRSQLVVDGPKSPPAILPLEPWRQALNPSHNTTIRALDDGRSALWLTSSTRSSIELNWRLDARSGSDGRIFELGFPRIDLQTVRLDLPEGLVPEASIGVRQGPEPGPTPDRRSWRLDGPGGPLTLQLRSTTPIVSSVSTPRFWLRGNTRVTVNDATARWEADWSLDPGPHGQRHFRFDLDSGLQLVDLTGPDVDGFQSELIGETVRVTVRLAETGSGPTRLQVKALARVPDVGAWTVPSARPLDSVWTGGRASLWIGPSRIVETCRDRAGHRVSIRPEDAERPSREGTLIAFETASPGSIAEVVFRKPWLDAAAEVRGQLMLGRDAPKIEATIRWKVDRGQLLALPLDLPQDWTLDRIQILGLDEPTSWRVENQPGSRTRVVVQPPAYLDTANPIALSLTATAIGPRTGPIPMPRIQPVGVRLAEDLWVARVESAYTVRPTRARDLAWLDPAVVFPEPSSSARPKTAPSHSSLAWRWTSPDGEGTLELQRSAAPPRGECWVVADLDASRLQVDWFLVLDQVSFDWNSLPVAFNEPLDRAPDWRVLDDEMGPSLVASPLEESLRQRLGLPAGRGPAWSLELPRREQGKRLLLHARMSSPWNGEGSIPLPLLPPQLLTRGGVLVTLDRSLRLRFGSTGLRIADRDSTRSAFTETFPGGSEDASLSSLHRLIQCFDYGPKPGGLMIRTERLQPVPSDGVIQEAVLDTDASPEGPCLHRLTLTIAPASARSIEVTLPDGSTLQRANRDGEPVVPSRLGSALTFSLGSPGSSKPTLELVLDYLTDRERAAASRDQNAYWPRFSMPCLASSWNVSSPTPWTIESAPSPMIVAEPVASPSWSRRLFGRWPDLIPSKRPSFAAEMRKDLDQRVLAIGPIEPTLGDWLTRIDAGSWPLVVDRVALASVGLGPRSRPIAAVGPLPKEQGAAAKVLQAFGLYAVPMDGLLLITIAEEAPDRSGGPFSQPGGRDAWVASLRDAATRGYDTTDRFLSVAQWRREATAETRESLASPATSHWERRRHFEQLGAPPSLPNGLPLVDSKSENALAWVVGLALVTLGLATRRLLAPRWRLLLVSIVLSTGLMAVVWSDGRAAPLAVGTICGSLAVLGIWLGSRLRPEPIARNVSSSRSSPVREALRAGSTMGLLLILVLPRSVCPRIVAQEPEPPPAILAIFPYDEVPDPITPGPKVILLLRDYERLARLARPVPNAPESFLGVLSARHVVRDGDPGTVVMESHYDLVLDGKGSADWHWPVGPSRDISATLDNQWAPISIEADGQTARVRVAGEGRHALKVRCAVPLDPRGRARASVPKVASSLLQIEPPLTAPNVECPGALGGVVSRENGLTIALGPVEHVDLRWNSGDRSRRDEVGDVEGLILWDLEPSGDRVRVRLSVRQPDGLTRLRLRLDPGMFVRSASFPGWDDATWEGTPSEPVWSAPIVSPLAEGEIVTLELWRPLPESSLLVRKPRPVPRVEPIRVARYSGLVALRAPDGWSTEILPEPIANPLIEDMFLRAWGPLPEGPTSLVGAVSWLEARGLEALAGPSSSGRKVRPRLHVDIAPGRLNVSAEARFEDPTGRTHELDAIIPPALQIDHIEAEGLTDWSRPNADRLRLRFDGPDWTIKTFRLNGWIPVGTSPMGNELSARELTVPWLHWQRVELEPGLLTISAPPSVPLGLEDRPGLTPLKGADLDLKEVTTLRAAYRVDRSEDLGVLRWMPDIPRASVSVFSQLTIHPQSADWVATARYEVAGGAYRSIKLEIPTEWADSARVEVGSGRADVRFEKNGAKTILNILLDPPAWASQQVVLRATRPFSTKGIAFPDLVPLGYGRVDTFLALVDLSGQSLVAEGSAGLQPVEPGRFDASSLPVPDAPERKVYHVLRDEWSLQIQLPADLATGQNGEAASLVSLLDIVGAIDQQRRFWGQARFELKPGAGPLLTVLLPAGSEPLAASVDNLPVRPMREKNGHVLIPLGDAPASRVVLAWTGPVLEGKNKPESGSIPLPSIPEGRVPTLLSIHTPEGVRIEPRDDSLIESPGDLIEVERAEELGRRILDRISRFDRGSSRERAALLALLVQYELQMRSARRMAQGLSASQSSWSSDVHVGVLSRLRAGQDALATALRDAGLEEFARSAEARVGLQAEDPLRVLPEVWDPVRVPRIRRIGRPSYFRGASPSDPETPSIAWVEDPAPSFWRRPEVLMVLGVSVLLTILVQVAASWNAHPRLLALLTLALVAPTVLLGVPASMLLAWFGMVGLGFFFGR